MAWLNAAPRPDNHRSGVDPEPDSRIAAMVKQDIAPPIPPNPAPYITAWLFEIGPSVPAGMGTGAIGWGEMLSWQDLSGIELMPWEAETLRRLSRDFVAMTHQSEKPDCPAPWSTPAMDQASRAAVAAKLTAAFAALQASGNRR